MSEPKLQQELQEQKPLAEALEARMQRGASVSVSYMLQGVQAQARVKAACYAACPLNYVPTLNKFWEKSKKNVFSLCG